MRVIDVDDSFNSEFIEKSFFACLRIFHKLENINSIKHILEYLVNCEKNIYLLPINFNITVPEKLLLKIFYTFSFYLVTKKIIIC